MVCRQQNMEEDRKERCRMKEYGRLLRGVHAGEEEKGTKTRNSTDTHLP